MLYDLTGFAVGSSAFLISEPVTVQSRAAELLAPHKQQQDNMLNSHKPFAYKRLTWSKIVNWKEGR